MRLRRKLVLGMNRLRKENETDLSKLRYNPPLVVSSGCTCTCICITNGISYGENHQTIISANAEDQTHTNRSLVMACNDCSSTLLRSTIVARALASAVILEHLEKYFLVAIWKASKQSSPYV